MSSSTPASTTDLLSSLLHKPLRITLTDGREITGRLYCIDDKKNIVLRNAVERRKGNEVTPLTIGLKSSSTRSIGMVMIPGKDAVKIEGLKKDISQ
ncbi:conserved hypothetical protein [Perkinsus marinus ATCC 50983]|uniref:Sm domain-containing protein n=1 Tax=Perkinsus marinus (strain ATCC 50983 / TXsc) TaxID=423536 RepID=C5K6D4_PERM5|nr:conserved hypothetical protein [Perkinsus marinus ATCC 50983]EER19854.1 conserved hypothetical protein [Perkinsus marinus ATCC 50983]|eukprot:XP_002788058.1 conserved hypothetical protein [Perkinsus marinus ATCC 50983]